MKTIKAPNGTPYISVLTEDQIIKIQIHRYDKEVKGGFFLTLDKRCIPDLITILQEVQ